MSKIVFGDCCQQSFSIADVRALTSAAAGAIVSSLETLREKWLSIPICYRLFFPFFDVMLSGVFVFSETFSWKSLSITGPVSTFFRFLTPSFAFPLCGCPALPCPAPSSIPPHHPSSFTSPALHPHPPAAPLSLLLVPPPLFKPVETLALHLVTATLTFASSW